MVLIYIGVMIRELGCFFGIFVLFIVGLMEKMLNLWIVDLFVICKLLILELYYIFNVIEVMIIS